MLFLFTVKTNKILRFSDFIALELVDGAVQLLINFGSGTVNLTIPAQLDDGEWHRVDVLWNSEVCRFCFK